MKDINNVKLKENINRKQLFLFVSTAIVVLTILMLRMLYSGLWYDEAVEYFYSKIPSGEVPGGFSTMTMYERICSTYQPPLYNALMYLWLSIFNGEFAFRLAGVLVTILGSVGVYFSINSFAGYRWASFGMAIYGLSASVAYYALECGEYNLLLCCLTWMIFFWIKCFEQCSIPRLIGFFLFGSLAVYSQYGAAFVVVGLFITLFIHLLLQGNKRMVRAMVITTIIVAAVFVIPLVYFFLIPHMQHPELIKVSHIPKFDKNIFYDIAKAILGTAYFNFLVYENGIILKGIIALIIAFAAFCTICSLRLRNAIFKSLIAANIISWLIYYFAVEFKFYGYTTYASGFGNRWGLAFLPLWFITLIYGIYNFWKYYTSKHEHEYKLLGNDASTVFLLIVTCIYCALNIYTIWINWTKDDVRELTSAWYSQNGYEITTVVHQWSDANFQFYLLNDGEYHDSYQENIVTAGTWIRDAEYAEMKEELDSLNIYDLQEFYYIGPNNSSLKVFIEVMKDEGYEIDTLYDGISKLLYLH